MSIGKSGTELPESERTTGSIPQSSLGRDGALNEIGRFEKREPNPDEKPGERHTVTTDYRQQKVETGSTVEQPNNLQKSVRKLAESAVPEDLSAKTGANRTKLTDDITQVLARNIEMHPELLNDPEKMAKKLMEPKRGEENLNTPEGRAAAEIRKYADNTAHTEVGDKYIINGVLVRDGLKQTMAKALTPEAMENLQQAMAADNNAKSPGQGSAAIATREQKSFEELARAQFKQQLIEADKNGNLEVHKNEIPELAANMKKAMSMLPPDMKKQLLKAAAEKEKDDPKAIKLAEKFSGVVADERITVTPDAALEIRKATIAGLKSPSPAASVAAGAEQEEAGKDGKKSGREIKSFGDIIMAIIDFFMDAVGIKRKDDTAVAQKDGQSGQKTAQGEGEKSKEQQKEAKLTPEEQKKSLDYLKDLGADFQQSIKNAGKELNGNGIMLAGLQKGDPQVQAGGGGKIVDASAGLGA